jgi:hypothetical protein
MSGAYNKRTPTRRQGYTHTPHYITVEAHEVMYGAVTVAICSVLVGVLFGIVLAVMVNG